MSAFEDDAPVPRLLGGRYLLEDKLGSGGMGVVYRATDQVMRRTVAVKLVQSKASAQLDDEIAGRFLREAKNTARLVHENIVELYDLGRQDDDLYFVMELLEGESLSAKLKREGKLDVRTVVHVIRQMCAALEVAHSAGIIHRDLKPANVMLVPRGNDPCFAKVLDFGVAKSFGVEQETQLTHTGMLVGTVEYMAPEQIMGRSVDGRTDLYALGIVMYRMLTGKQPFRDGGVPALIHAHLNKYPAPISELVPEVPGEIDRVVLRCLAKDPAQRYESMTELSRALAAALTSTDSLMSLEYEPGESDDVYQAGDMTEVARGARAGDATVGGAGSVPRLPADDAGSSYGDSTVKMDRPSSASDRLIPSASRNVRSPRIDERDSTALMAREDQSTRKRKIEIPPRLAGTPRECAMCHTMNAPHARACAACGVSLAIEDQEAVRARVNAPAPQPISGGYAVPQGPYGGPGHPGHAGHATPPSGRPSQTGYASNAPGAPGPSTPPHAPGAPSWGPPGRPSGTPSAPGSASGSSSVWERLLKLTGLR
ncbi:MAG: Serine/threonine-protein kinase PknB [Labilithrix sp.]|nr:Serine/threonine-protein kinase PknB [Labilithrix sp.]